MDQAIQGPYRNQDWSRVIDGLIRVSAFSHISKAQYTAIIEQLTATSPGKPSWEEINLWYAGWSPEKRCPNGRRVGKYSWAGDNGNMLPVVSMVHRRLRKQNPDATISEAVTWVQKWVELGLLGES